MVAVTVLSWNLCLINRLSGKELNQSDHFLITYLKVRCNTSAVFLGGESGAAAPGLALRKASRREALLELRINTVKNVS